MVVEPRLPDRDHLGMARGGDQPLDGHVELLVGMVRMGADRAIDLRKALGDGDDLGVALDPGRDGDDAPDAHRLRARHHGVELAGEIGKIEMAVAVDQHALHPRTGAEAEAAQAYCVNAAHRTLASWRTLPRSGRSRASSPPARAGAAPRCSRSTAPRSSCRAPR